MDNFMTKNHHDSDEEDMKLEDKDNFITIRHTTTKEQ